MEDGMGELFPTEELLTAINEIEKAYKLPVPKPVQQVGFCIICLGAYAPGEKDKSRGAWCCGSWCDGLLPFWRLCERWKLDRRGLDRLAETVRPDGTGTSVHSS